MVDIQVVTQAPEERLQAALNDQLPPYLRFRMEILESHLGWRDIYNIYFRHPNRFIRFFRNLFGTTPIIANVHHNNSWSKVSFELTDTGALYYDEVLSAIEALEASFDTKFTLSAKKTKLLLTENSVDEYQPEAQSLEEPVGKLHSH